LRWFNPVHFTLDANLDRELKLPGATQAVIKSLQTWSQANPGLQVSWEVGRPDPQVAQNVIRARSEWNFKPTSLAVTVASEDYVNNAIVDADIFINAQQDFSRYDLQGTLTHELGHALGLDHELTLPAAVMYPEGLPGDERKRELTEDDLAGISAQYGSATQPPAGASAVGCGAAASPAVAPSVVLAALALLRLARRRT
jgi:Matrixin